MSNPDKLKELTEMIEEFIPSCPASSDAWKDIQRILGILLALTDEVKRVEENSKNPNIFRDMYSPL